MTALALSIGLIALFAAGICALPYLYAAWRRINQRSEHLEIWRVLRLRAIEPAAIPGNELARALRRCTFCPSLERCEHWLVSPETDDLADFCPNAALFARVDRDSAS